MGIELNDILAKSKTITFEHEGDTFEVEFSTNFYTPRLHITLTSGDVNKMDLQLDTTVQAIKKWNVEDKGKMVIPTRELFEDKLGLALANKLYTEMENAIFPK